MALLGVFALQAWGGIRGKNATYDEVLHTPASWINTRCLDYRINFEDPPLWKYWAALPLFTAPPRVNTDSSSWRAMPQDPTQQWRWSVETLYRTPGNDADALVNKSRIMMLTAGLALGAVMGWWGWHLGGAAAAVVTTGLFSFDPNFLAYAPLVKNDVALTLVLVALFFALWRLGSRATWPRVAAVALLCAAGPCVKFSGLIAGPLVLLLLMTRGLLPGPWLFFGKSLSQRRRKLLAGLRIFIPVAATCFLAVWTCYGFRYRATPEPDVKIDTRQLLNFTAVNEILAGHPERPVTDEELRRWRPGLLVQGILLAQRYRLLPEAWLNGLLYTHMTTRLQSSFLCGEFSAVGWWYYFPLAVLFKTPAATLLSGILAAMVLLFFTKNAAESKHRLDLWALLCLAVPFTLYAGLAFTSNVNLGLRHALPLYPFSFILIGWAASRAWRLWRWRAGLVIAALAAGLVTESVASFPNYLGFFNTVSGGSRAGIHLLGDSNMDWGQDLKTLASWARENPDRKLQLCYFGMADPAYYGIDYINLPGGYRFGPRPRLPVNQGIVAISATHLQGIHFRPDLRRLYAPLREAPPMTVLGTSIYLYDSGWLAGQGREKGQ